jgi:hypothetical protein
MGSDRRQSTLSRNWQIFSKRQRTDNKQTVTFAWPVEAIPVCLSVLSEMSSGAFVPDRLHRTKTLEGVMTPRKTEKSSHSNRQTGHHRPLRSALVLVPKTVQTLINGI